MRNFFATLFIDESNHGSSKRVVGTLCVLALIYALVMKVNPPEYLVEALKYIAIALFFATSTDKAVKLFESLKKSKKDEEQH